MEYKVISGTEMNVSRIAQGTWAIGGWMWGGTDERESIRTIHAALDKEINLIDTAPVYGFGVSEEIVGKAIEERGHREKVFIATKVGLEWHNGSVTRNSSPGRIRKEVQDSCPSLSYTPSSPLITSLSGKLIATCCLTYAKRIWALSLTGLSAGGS
jgi:aryl-alcohol dehydrogenase-like predicted oxidoreductase